ncbi:MAG: hypothetical protein ACM3OO_02350 [Planctomycetaceae bacterium]
MTRYLCVHPSHEREGRLRPVDVTAQVRLERAFAPRSSAYLAISEDVLRRVPQVRASSTEDRVRAIREILTGTPWPLDAPVVLVSERRAQRSPGLFELDELRSSERTVEDLLRRASGIDRGGGGSDDLVMLADGGEVTEPRSLPASQGGLDTETAVRTAPQRTRVIPQGIFPAQSLALALAQARGDEDSIVEAIRSVPLYREPRGEQERRAWRVVVECPVATGEPPLAHRTVFTGTGEQEPAFVFGTPAEGTWDALIEDAAAAEFAPRTTVRAATWRLRATVIAELVIVVVLAVLGWLSGGLATAMRETPGWFGLGLALAVSAVAIGAFGLFAPARPDGNPNDTLVLRRSYESRVDLLWWSSVLSVGLFAAALVATLVPTALVSEHVVPSPTIAFDTTKRPVIADVRLEATGLPTDAVLIVDMRQFGSGDTTGTLVGRSSATGDANGVARVHETVSLDQKAQYLAVMVVRQGDTPPTCTPEAVQGPGCTIVAVPPLGAGVTIVPSPATLPSVAPSASAFPSASTFPSASAFPSASVSPSAGVFPSAVFPSAAFPSASASASGTPTLSVSPSPSPGA